MAIINLKDYYPFYTVDELVEVPDSIAAAMQQFERSERSYQRKCRYHLHCSMECINNIARHFPSTSASPETHFEQAETCEQVWAALAVLPKKQAKRIFACFFLGKSKAEIARIEGVQRETVRESIALGLKALEQYLEGNLQKPQKHS